MQCMEGPAVGYRRCQGLWLTVTAKSDWIAMYRYFGCGGGAGGRGGGGRRWLAERVSVPIGLHR